MSTISHFVVGPHQRVMSRGYTKLSFQLWNSTIVSWTGM